MPLASLDSGSPAWRAGRAACAITSLLRRDSPGDEALGALVGLGQPPGGWWDHVVRAQASGSVTLLLPRPGDPRGVPWPRSIAPEAAIGWGAPSGSTWLVPTDRHGWEVHHMDAPPPQVAADVDADRALRQAVIGAAHRVDAFGAIDAAPASGQRDDHERIIESWIASAPGLPPRSRPLAALGLRILLAIDDARELVDVIALESAARGAVEAAFSASHADH